MNSHFFNYFSETNPGGIIGITINTDHYAPSTNSAADVNAADLQFEMQMGYWAEPIYGSGDYPDQVKKVLKVRFDADAEKRPLPEFNEAQVKLNQDYRSDFFGLNHYTTSLISRKPNCDAPDDSQCLEFRSVCNLIKLNSLSDWLIRRLTLVLLLRASTSQNHFEIYFQKVCKLANRWFIMA